jgi:glyoxylase-like metal-dependent hydrolase (beta-lactamase superfamily II)
MKRFICSCNCYLFNDILIDPGKGIAAHLETINWKPKTVVITHEHCDHFAGLDRVDCADVAASKFCADVINEKKNEFGMCSYFNVDYPKKKVNRILKDGDVIKRDGCTLKVIETPGHAKGAICLYDEDAKILFSGDTVFPDMGIPRTDLLSSEPEKLKESYSKLSTLDIKTIYPGHGNEITEKEYVKKIMKNLV